MPTREEDIMNIFPAEEDIPAEVQFEFPIRQTEYLVKGELVEWEGELKEVYSPVFIKDSERKFNPEVGRICSFFVF